MQTLRICLLVALLAPGAVHADDVAAVFDKVRHAVFMIIVTTDDPRVVGMVDVVAQGSAVLIAPYRLVTNCHVAERGSIIFVSSREDKLIARARISSRHAPTDLCELDLLQQEAAFAKPVEVAPSGAVKSGDPVYAIGSPNGMGLTISEGIVSAFREATRSDIKVIQTTAPFSPGSSGGGLFDRNGRLVGITTSIMKDARNLHFAVSSRYIRSAGLSEVEIAEQRGAALAAALDIPRESAAERNEKLRREEPTTLVARPQPLESARTDPGTATSAAPQVRRRTP